MIVGLGLDACVCVVRRSLWSAVGRRRRGDQRWDSDLGAGRPEEGAGVGADRMSPARRERKPSQQGLQTLEELAVYRKEPGFSRLHDAAESLSSFRESCSPGFYSSGLGEGSFHASGAVVTVRLSSMAAARTQNREIITPVSLNIKPIYLPGQVIKMSEMARPGRREWGAWGAGGLCLTRRQLHPAAWFAWNQEPRVPGLRFVGEVSNEEFYAQCLKLDTGS